MHMGKTDTKKHFDSQSRSIQRLYFVTVIVTLIAVSMLAIYSFSAFYADAVDSAMALGESTLARETEQLNAYLAKGIDVLQVTAITVEAEMRSGASSEKILNILTDESTYYKEEVDDNYTGVYGWINGKYLDGIGWVPDADYVPQERVWYTTAMEAGGKSVIVSPYLDAQTNTIMISVAQRLYDGESVISYDIAMNAIQEITEGISLSDQGYGLVCDKEGLVVAHSDIREKGKNYLENPAMADFIQEVYAKGKSSFRTEIYGEECTVFVDTIMDEWYVVMVVNNIDLFRNVQDILVRNIIICVVIFVLIVLFCTMALKKAGQNMNALLESRKQLNRLNETILKILAKTIDANDKYTKGHSVRVAEYSKELAKRMGKSKEEQKEIYNAALLHDIGKIRIPSHVINKSGKLTNEEYELIKLHPVAGYHILKEISDNQVLAIGAKFHHERYDGKGYPNGLIGENIPEYARIIGVADAYDAMSSNRSYREILPQEVVRQEIEKGRGRQFDPEVADIMLEMMQEDTNYEMKQNNNIEKTVLAVDDEIVNLDMLEEIFKGEPLYHFIGALSGEKALNVLAANKVDMVFLDMEMPGMNGYDTLKKIKEKYNVPVVFMTEKKDIDVQKTTELGVEDYLTKPFLPGILMEIVHIVLNQ